MTSVIFDNWLKKWNFQLKTKENDRKICFIIDNCSAHALLENYSNIEVLFLPPNTTSLSQPCDAGIIYSFKAKYRQFLLEKIIQNHDDAQIFGKINFLDALRIVRRAWDAVTLQTVKKCFQKVGVVEIPINELVAAENEDDCFVVENSAEMRFS